MEQMLGALLGLLSLGVLLWPFVRWRRAPAPSSLAEEVGVLQRRREAIYEGIRSLELEHELGQVEPQEYQRRLHAYRLEAAVVLQEQEAIEVRLRDLDEALEGEVRRARASLDRAGTEAAEPGEAEPGATDKEGEGEGEERSS
jgi:hypothetical protein